MMDALPSTFPKVRLGRRPSAASAVNWWQPQSVAHCDCWHAHVIARCNAAVQGLRVLLVDDEHNTPLVSAQLCQPELQYAGVSRSRRPHMATRAPAAHCSIARRRLCSPPVPLLIAVTMCGSASEALAYTSALPAAFDVILAEVRPSSRNLACHLASNCDAHTRSRLVDRRNNSAGKVFPPRVPTDALIPLELPSAAVPTGGNRRVDRPRVRRLL